MKFNEIKLPRLSNAKGIAISKKFLIFCTGKKALVYDRKLQLLQEIKGLSYCYDAYISPDEKKVLLISTGNAFYILSLEDFVIERYNIRGKYKGNLEGRGCWSFDGKNVFLCIQEADGGMLSALRSYQTEKMSEYEDLLYDKYWLTSITPIYDQSQYLLIGLNRVDDKNYMIWYNGSTFEPYYIEDFDDVVVHAEYDVCKRELILSGLEYTIICDCYGKKLKTIHGTGDTLFSFSDVFKGCGLQQEGFKDIKALSNAFGFENALISDSILCACYVKDGKYICIGTMTSLCCMEAESSKIVAQRKIPHGVHDIVEIEKNIILVSTWQGVKAYNITE